MKNTILGCQGQNNKWLVEPKNLIASLYGQVKCHKEGAPLRPIAKGYSHLVHRAELYLKKILEPLINKCTYLVDSQKAFKTRFLVEKDKFINSDHEIVTFDIKAMYPNINLTKTINYIITTIFRAPQTYFKQEKDNKIIRHRFLLKKNSKVFCKVFCKISIILSPKLALSNNSEELKWVAL